MVKWHGRTREHYEVRGYKFTKSGDEFEVKVEDLSKGSVNKVEYVCDICRGDNQFSEKEKWKTYDQIYYMRKKRNGLDICPKCAVKIRNKKSLETRHGGKKNLAETHPHLISEWSSKNEKKISDFLPNSNQRVWWICKDNHEWETVISSRAIGTGCPYCSGKITTRENSLAAKMPSIIREWHHNKNNDLTPYEVPLQSNKKVWWVCEKGHEWEAVIYSRTGKKKLGCPDCSRSRISINNCLETNNPELASEWHPTKNGDLIPSKVGEFSMNKVWWLGSCGHEWKAIINNRSRGRGCPYCNESKGEKRVREILTVNNVSFTEQFEIEGLVGLMGKPLKFDFAILNEVSRLVMLIEYDGEFHFKKIYDGDDFEKMKEHDKRKNEYCIKENIPLIRIPYWNFDNIEEILIKKVIKVIKKLAERI